MKAAPRVRFAIDRGGTFTDVYAEYGGKYPLVIKLLSEDPHNYDDAPREGIRRALEIITGRPQPQYPLATDSIDDVRMGTTVGANALLERSGETTALLISRGFRDLLQIGYQDRPDIFDLKISKPALLYQEVLDVNERVRPAAQGDAPHILKCGINDEMFKIIQAPDPDEVRSDLKRLRDMGINSLAIVLMHSYAFPDHERLVGKIARELGFRQVSMSSEVMPMLKIVAGYAMTARINNYYADTGHPAMAAAETAAETAAGFIEVANQTMGLADVVVEKQKPTALAYRPSQLKAINARLGVAASGQINKNPSYILTENPDEQ